ncbi:transporter substrate-binding domain-containing protein [Tabrizicola aquatica]|uniref:transporter substrate-binding domain-containing protein n=1 Tax=Tabrizicola aquatica TaxID=909926 RepID=UPI000CD1F085|nr:transporter substrate-binding domain-containing protein [Tabrizicola aquatica]
MNTAKMLALGCTALTLTGGSALAQDCGVHVVTAGDNLRYIARDAYGDADLYRLIYEANVDKIGPKADHIEIGMELRLPCADGQTAEAAAPAVVQSVAAEPAAAEAVATAPEPTAPAPAAEPQMAVRIVTGNNFAPYVDEALPGGGMFTQLVEMAMFRADPGLPYNMTFVNDWQAHLDALLPSLAYDLSFPWIRPDCETPATLTASDLSRCENFEFSAPFVEIVDGFFALRDSELIAATKYSDLLGKRICRPEGYTSSLLEANGLTTDQIQLTRPERSIDCFEALVAGQVDLVSIDAKVGDSLIAQLGVVKLVEQNPHLANLTSLHVIAHKSNQRAVGMLAKLDEGIVEMYESGEWYEIVSTALTRDMRDQ